MIKTLGLWNLGFSRLILLKLIADVAKDVLTIRGFHVVGGILSPVHDDFVDRKPVIMSLKWNLKLPMGDPFERFRKTVQSVLVYLAFHQSLKKIDFLKDEGQDHKAKLLLL